MKTQMFAGAILAALVTTAAYGQTYVAGGGSGNSSSGYHFPHGGYGSHYSGYHSSTHEEGVLRGLADLTRAGGDANYMNSLAAINRQEAVKRYLENKEQNTETYFRVRQINRAAREAQRPQPLTHEQYVALAKKLAPDRLTAQQYDRVLGRLTWPAPLMGEEFAAERLAIEKMFAGRTPVDVGVGSAFHGKVRQLSSSMREKLQDNLSELSPMEFIAAKEFLDSLSYEAQQPLVVEALASAE